MPTVRARSPFLVRTRGDHRLPRVACIAIHARCCALLLVPGAILDGLWHLYGALTAPRGDLRHGRAPNRAPNHAPEARRQKRQNGCLELGFRYEVGLVECT
jgi:hypothetical protein